MKTNGTRYSPTFKFQVVLEALKAKGRGTELQVACASRVVFHDRGRVEEALRKRGKRGQANKDLAPVARYSSPVTRGDYWSPIKYFTDEGTIAKMLVEKRAQSGSPLRGAGPEEVGQDALFAGLSNRWKD